ncbi:hypothetical protein N9764_04910 [Polaribacter sp.]|nr:hypothetical protein [Polaribacter sp.]MDB4204879.1 hypothetical protein [Polaribacter sp.]
MKIKVIIIFLLAFTIQIKSQNKQQKWAAGISLAGAKYTTNGPPLVEVSPRINISRYIFKGLSLDFGFATALGDTQTYTTFDGAFRFDFGRSNYNVVPYILIGASSLKGKVITSTINIGVGNTFWLSSKYGLNFQLIYKYSKDIIQSQRSHLYPSLGLVYSFGARNLNPRIWQD